MAAEATLARCSKGSGTQWDSQKQRTRQQIGRYRCWAAAWTEGGMACACGPQGGNLPNDALKSGSCTCTTSKNMRT